MRTLSSVQPDNRLGRPARRRRVSRRDRRGRGLRERLAPHGVPIVRSRAARFDELVLDAVADLERTWSSELSGIEFAIEEVPPGRAEFDPDVVSDRGIALGRLYRHGVEGVTKPVIVIYRRPLEARAADLVDRGDLVFTVVTELVAELLGKDVDDLDPPH